MCEEGQKEEERHRTGRCKGGLCRGTEMERMQNERVQKELGCLVERKRGGNEKCAEKANRNQYSFLTDCSLMREGEERRKRREEVGERDECHFLLPLLDAAAAELYLDQHLGVTGHIF